MRDTPDQPGRPASEGHPAEIRHRIVAADCREAAAMAVAEWRRRGSPLDARPDHPCGVSPHLLRRRSDTGRELSVPAERRAGIDDHKAPRLARHLKICEHPESP